MAIVGIIIHMLHHFLYVFISGWLGGADLSLAATKVSPLLGGLLATWLLLLDGLELLEDRAGVAVSWNRGQGDSLSFPELLEHKDNQSRAHVNVVLLLKVGDN